MDVMHILEKRVRIAGQNYIAPEVVLLMPFMPVVLFEASMNRDVNFLENVWNVPL